MEKIFSLAELLAASLRESDHYKNYLTAKAKVSSDPELLLKINEFKRSHVDYQSKLLSGSNPPFEEEKHVSEMYWELMLDEDARLYFTSEKSMLDIISDTQKIILDGCQMDFNI